MCIFKNKDLLELYLGIELLGLMASKPVSFLDSARLFCSMAVLVVLIVLACISLVSGGLNSFSHSVVSVYSVMNCLLYLWLFFFSLISLTFSD